MFRRIETLTKTIADYTVGTVIVMIHIATAERTARAVAQQR